MNRPLRIAMFVRSFPEISETFIVRQIIGLLELGHEVQIFAESCPDPMPPLQPEVVQHRLLERSVYLDLPPASSPWEMPVRPFFGRTWLPGESTSHSNLGRVVKALPKLLACAIRAPGLTARVLRSEEYGYQAESLSALHRLAGLLKFRGRFDVAHAHFGTTGKSFRMVRQLWGIPYVVSFYGYDFSVVPKREGPEVYRSLFPETDRVLVISEHTQRRVAALGCPAEKFHRLALGVDPQSFPFRERALLPGEIVRVLTVGRLVEKKGIEDAIRAVGLARQAGLKIVYEVIGGGPLQQHLENVIRELGLEDCVQLLGARDGAFVRQKMAEAHLFLLSSVTAANGDEEGQGLVLQEAQACGLPVLVTRHGPFPEGVIEGESARIVPERDPEALGRELIELAAHSERWSAMGRAGRRLVEERFDNRQLSRQLAELYAGIIRQRLGGVTTSRP